METTPKTASEALAYLASRSPSTIRLGLERMHQALEVLGHPERRYPILQVAGTNGKGSTCAFASQALLGHGLKVGRYTSPHLERVNERFWISGADVTNDTLGKRILEVVEGVGPLGEELTYFELGTIVALWHFAHEKVDAAILEVGLGGRLDATTATTPQVTAIASISLDHTETLGNTIALVAAEKAGILKSGIPAVVSAQSRDAEQVIRNHARAIGAPVAFENVDFALEDRGEAYVFRSKRGTFAVPELSLRGGHQIHNAALALAAAEELAEGRWALNPQTLALAMGHTFWPGRLEEISRAPMVVVDGAHNPDGAQMLVRALHALYPGARVHLVFGVLAEKDAVAMRRTLFPGCASIHLTELPSPRTSRPEDAEEEARRHTAQVTVHHEPISAIEAAVKQAGSLGVVVCAGSLVLAGAARGWAAAQKAIAV